MDYSEVLEELGQVLVLCDDRLSSFVSIVAPPLMGPLLTIVLKAFSRIMKGS